MTKSTESVKALIYLRVARDEPPREAAARQRRVCERRAAELGLEVAGIYTDQGSGNSLSRPGLTTLLADLGHRDDVTYVLTFDHGRIALKLGDYSKVAWAISKAGARLEIASVPHCEAGWARLPRWSVADELRRNEPSLKVRSMATQVLLRATTWLTVVLASG